MLEHLAILRKEFLDHLDTVEDRCAPAKSWTWRMFLDLLLTILVLSFFGQGKGWKHRARKGHILPVRAGEVGNKFILYYLRGCMNFLAAD
jgi:hypothetical protein